MLSASCQRMATALQFTIMCSQYLIKMFCALSAGCQRMATALQSATIHLPPQTGRATTYAWAPARSQLYAAGVDEPLTCSFVCTH